jgi:hypothetical protein
VVVVEENREQADVVSRRFRFLVVVVADFLRRLLRDSAVPPSSLISLNVSIFCGLPSSDTSKSDA